MKRFAFILCALLSLAGARAAETAQLKTFDLTINRYDSIFSEADNDVFMVLYTEDYEATLRLDIKVEEGQRYFTNGKTYTWDDMIQKFCYAYVKDEYREYKFADATFTWWLDELGLEHFSGSALDSAGNTYNFRYDVLPYIPTGDTIEVTFSQSMKMEHSTDWYFTGTEGDYYLLLTLFNDGDSPVGHYTEENIDIDFSYIDKSLGGGNFELIYFHHAEIDVTEAADDTLRIEAMIAAMDTNVYHFQAFYSAPKPKVKKTITATDLYINTDYLYGLVGAIRVEASDEEQTVVFAFSPMSQDLNIYDTYQINSQSPNIGYVTAFADPDTQNEVYEGTITIAKTENGATVTGKILCYDDTEYTIDLSHFVPEKTREADLTIDGMQLQLSTQGAWRLSGYSDDMSAYVSVVLNNWEIEGEYSYVEMSRDFTYVVTDITWDGGDVDAYTYFDLLDADLKAEIELPDSIVTVTGTLLVQNKTDIPLFNVHLSNKPSEQQALPEVPFTPAAATKRIENGMIVIEKNGKLYNAVGAELR